MVPADLHRLDNRANRAMGLTRLVQPFQKYACLIEYGAKLVGVGHIGYGMQDGEDLIIRISIGAKNLAGDLLVMVVVSDDNEPTQRLSASFRSGYSALGMFKRDIARMVNREIPEAVLHGY